MSPLQQDSEQRLASYRKQRDEAKQQGQAMIKRVEIFNATH
jgi:hypothetical protein